MSAAATLRIDSARSPRKEWTPSDRDRLVFQWVKFEGHKQSWVADQLGVHQTTVSRMVERYEKWIAHGQPGAGGLTHDERLRSQRALTYERNEWILTSALRIAGEMEGFTDVTKSTVRHTADNPDRKAEVRTENAVIDRSGVAARFLRLAFRVNMEQLKLIEQDSLPPLDPLSADEWEAMIEDDFPVDEVLPLTVAADRSSETTAFPGEISHSADAAITDSSAGPDVRQSLHEAELQTVAGNVASDDAEVSSGERAELTSFCGDAYAVVASSPDSGTGRLSVASGAVAPPAMCPS